MNIGNYTKTTNNDNILSAYAIFREKLCILW